jgi:hypothetical protein
VELILKDDVLWKSHVEIKGKRKKLIAISQQNSPSTSAFIIIFFNFFCATCHAKVKPRNRHAKTKKVQCLNGSRNVIIIIPFLKFQSVWGGLQALC